MQGFLGVNYRCVVVGGGGLMSFFDIVVAEWIKAQLMCLSNFD